MQFLADLLVCEIVLEAHDANPFHVDVVNFPVVPRSGLLILDPDLPSYRALLKECLQSLQFIHVGGGLLVLELSLGPGFHLNFKLIS